MKTLYVNRKYLRKQISAVLNSRMPSSEKNGLHNMLGDILDGLDEDFQIRLQRDMQMCGRCGKIEVDEDDNIDEKFGKICQSCYYEV